MTPYKKQVILCVFLLLLLHPFPAWGTASPKLTAVDDSLTATWDAADEKVCIGILAVYSANGALLQCTYQTTQTPVLSIKLSKATLANTNLVVKTMLWDAQTLTPLCQPAATAWETLHDTPFPASFTALPGKMVIRFQSVGAGLQVNGLRANGSFSLCGSDGLWYDARAQVTAFDTITVYGREGEYPAGVQYQPGKHPTAGAITSVQLTPVQAFSYTAAP